MAALGMGVMVSSGDLISLYVGVELQSLALYVLAALNPKRAESGEAALKYFVLGAFSSAVFVYGIALTYGATGSTNLPQIADYLSKNVVAGGEREQTRAIVPPVGVRLWRRPPEPAVAEASTPPTEGGDG